MNLDQEKRELRQSALARRGSVEPTLRRDKSAEICRQLEAVLGCVLLTDRLQVPVVAVYSAIGSETDPAPFARYAENLGCTVAYPCMLPRTEADACGQRMCMRAVRGADAASAPFIAHPARALPSCDIDSARFPVVPAEAIDLIVVPLVAFDAHGMRLGYGGGCYDRYLPALHPGCQVIGIAFNEQQVDQVPAGPHDRTLPRIICA